MHQLHRALDEDAELRAVVGQLSELTSSNRLKHAIVLDLNPYWLAAHRFADAGFGPSMPWDAIRWGSLGAWPIGLGGGVVDLNRTFPHVEDLTTMVFGARRRPTPYMLRVFAAPAVTMGDLERRRSLVDVARNMAIPTIIETEERARLIASPGDRISTSGSVGTLGGFLRDRRSGITYAVSCGHVVSCGAVSTPAGSLGTCTHAHVPTPLPAGVVCTTGCPQMTRLDISLIDAGTRSVSNIAKSIASLVARGDLVEMQGAKTGRMTYEVGGAVVELDLAGSCWDRLFLLHAPTAGILPLGVRVTTHPVPQQGDSGAWILRSNTEWAGMVVAQSGLHGYALPATIALSESDSRFGMCLHLA